MSHTELLILCGLAELPTLTVCTYVLLRWHVLQYLPWVGVTSALFSFVLSCLCSQSVIARVLSQLNMWVSHWYTEEKGWLRV